MPYRLIHSLRIEYAHDGPGKREIIVNLRPDGTNRLKSGARPRPPKMRIVDLRIGDEVLVEGQWRNVLGIRTFFEREVSDGEAAEHGARETAEGWIGPRSTVSPR
jgi:hypothetical protein